MSDTASHDLTPDSESADNQKTLGGISVAGVAQLLKAMAPRGVTQADLAEFSDVRSQLLDVVDGLEENSNELAQMYFAALSSSRDAPSVILETFDEARAAAAEGETTLEGLNPFPLASDPTTILAEEGGQAADAILPVVADAASAAGVVGAAVAAAYELYEYAGGTPDAQAPTLLAGSTWNPAGDSQAPSRLANVPAEVISVANEAQLVAAINQVNASPGNYTIRLTASIVLTSNLPAISQPTGSVRIDGEGNLLYGSNAFSGLVVDGANATIQNLIVQDFGAQGSAGGQGSSEGEGSGLLAINGANVVVDNVRFVDDSAAGDSGGAVYADASSSVTTQGSSFSGTTASGSQGDGISVSLSGNEAVTTATVKQGQTTTLDGGIADQGGPGDIDVLVAQGGGTVVLSGTESFSGVVVVTAGTTVELTDMAVAGAGSITFDSQGSGTLRIDPAALEPTKDLGTHLSGMTVGDRVDLVGLSGATQVSVGTPMASTTTGNGQPVTTVTVSNGTQTESLNFVGLNGGAQFALASDGQGGTMLTMTQAIPTPTGLSETSANGVLTFSGAAQAGSTVTLYQVQLGTQTLLQLGTATVGENGQFTLTPGTQPDAGAGPVTAVATDSYGNASFLSHTVALPAGAGGNAPVTSPGMVAPAPGSIVVRVGTEAQLAAAITEANTNNSHTSLAIQFTNNITLSGTEELPALQDGSGVQIVGNGYALQGNGVDTRGLMLFGANATIDNLTIADTVALGGGGGLGAAGGGGGAGLGGGLMVAGDSTVTLDDVNFVNDRAIGGAGGESGGTGGGFGGGGGLGGDGGSAMQNTSMEISGGGGGIGTQAAGGNAGAAGQTAGGAGIVAGAPSDQGSGAAGGVSGGGGAGGTATPGVLGQGDAGLDGGGGGIYGLSGSDTSEGGYGSTGGWGGGGGGNATFGGDGGFGGGGGGDSNQGGHGGFGGGGGGGTPARVSTGAPGGFGGGAGGAGTNNSADDGGGGGLGAGGAVFVEQGSKLTVENNSSSSGDSVAGGQGQSGGQDGQAYGSGWFIQGNQSLTMEANAGQTTTISDVIADETGSHDQSGATGAGSLIIEGRGTVALDASNTYTGGTVIDGGHLELGAAGSAGSGNITFEGAHGSLTIDPAAAQGLTNVLTGFSHGDRIDLVGVPSSEGMSAKVIGTVMTPAGTQTTVVGISNSEGTQLQQLQFQGLAPNAKFVMTSDGHGGTTLRLAPSSGGAAGNVSNLGSNDARAELSVALQGTPPVPGGTPEADSGAGSAAAGRDPIPESALVALPGTHESQTIASAPQGGQDTMSGHHTR